MIQNNRGELLKFEKQIKRQIQNNPSDPKLFLNFLHLKCQLNKLDDVKLLVKNALSSDRFSGSAYFYYANMVLSYRLREEALLLYNKSIEKEKSNAGAYINRGCIFHEQFEYELAVSDFDAAIKLQPDIAEAYKNKANSLEEMDQVKEALSNMKEALRLRADYFEARIGLGRLYQKLKEYEQSKSIYFECLEKYPNNLDILSRISTLPPEFLLEDEAKSLLEKLNHLDKVTDLFSLHMTRARLLARLENLQASFDEIRHAKAIRHEKQKELLTDWKKKQELITQKISKWRPGARDLSASVEDTDLLMIFGPSRSGKTTLENALHPEEQFIKSLEGKPASNAIRKIKDLHQIWLNDQKSFEVSEVMDALVYSNSIKNRHSGQIVTVTNPFLIEVAHLIYDLYPSSKFIFIERVPQENAIEIFTKSFKSSAAFSDTYGSALGYVNWYNDTSSQLAEKMSSRAIKIKFESLLNQADDINQRINDLLRRDISLQLPTHSVDVSKSRYSVLPIFKDNNSD